MVCLCVLIMSNSGLFACGDERDLSGCLYKDGYYYNLIFDGTGVQIMGTDINEKKLIIPEQIDGLPVLEIGEEAFIENTFESVILPSQLVRVEKFAFFGCDLKKVIFPESLEFIGYSAFACNELEWVSFPKYLKTLELHSFSNNKIKRIKWPQNLKSIPDGVFRDNQLTEVYIPDSVRVIERNAFRQNEIRTVHFNAKLLSIEYCAFFDNSIYSVDLPKELEFIDSDAFTYNKIGSVILPQSLKRMGRWAFHFNQMTQVTIGENVEILDEAYNFDFGTQYNLLGAKAGTYSYQASNKKWAYEDRQPQIDKSRILKDRTVVDFKLGDHYMWINGVKQNIDSGNPDQPIVKNDRLYLPLIPTIKALHAYEREGDPYVHATYAMGMFLMSISKDMSKIDVQNGGSYSRSDLYVEGKRMYIDAIFIEKCLADSVKWDKKMNTIRIIKK